MAQAGRVSTSFSSRFSRRAFLASSGIATLALAACGDESSTRQFAGGPETPGDDASPQVPGQAVQTGSPTALATQMPVAQLLSPRGNSTISVIAYPDRLVAVDLDSGESSDVWSNPGRAIWAVGSTNVGEQVALLTAPKESATGWFVDFVDADGESFVEIELGARRGTPEHRPDAVAAGRGGLAWIGETASVAVALPSGGLLQVFADGSQVGLLSASAAKRPSAVAITPDAGTIAYVDQPTGAAGSGIYAASMKAKPIDPIVVLPADRSGNRFANDLAWIGSGGRIATIIEREELGNSQGDLFYVDTASGIPTLAWTSPTGRDVWSVESFALSDDGEVVSFLTNPSNPDTHKPSSIWMMQVDGGAVERFELPVGLRESRLVFSPYGVAISGIVRPEDDQPGMGAVYLVSPSGEVLQRYLEAPMATPVASPEASPLASPVASPEASPSPQAVTGED